MVPFVIFFVCLGQLGLPAQAAKPEAQDLTVMARTILRQVEAMRGQTLSKPLVMGVKKREQVTAFVRERLAQEYGAEKVAAEGDLLKIQGLMPADLEYGKLLTALLTEQVAGFYDHTRQELHIADWLPAPLQGPVMAHEIFHAIQDQEWGGGKLIDSKRYGHDALLAHAALMEGDATVVMLNYQQRTLGSNDDVSTSTLMISAVAAGLPMQMSSPQYPVMAAAPAYVKNSLIFPYQQGLLFVAALRRSGLTWAQIRDVYADPPSSTEQIMHPKRYLPPRDKPSEVRFDGALLQGYRTRWSGTLGEFHLQQLLLTAFSQVEASRAATGWDGDWTRLESKGDAHVAVTYSTWDSQSDAVAFEAALRSLAAKVSKSPSTLQVLRQDQDVIFAFGSDRETARAAMQKAIESVKVSRR